MTNNWNDVLVIGSGEGSAPEEWLSEDDPRRIAFIEQRTKLLRLDLFNRTAQAVKELPSEQREQISDGYHTFKELYDHRVELWIALCRIYARHTSILAGINTGLVWRSRLHSDGTSFEGWFVLGIGYEKGEQMTYHLPLERWQDCDFAIDLTEAPEFDGHSSVDVLERLKQL